MKQRVLINPEKKIGPINDMIFGNFIENLGYCMYGGVYDSTSPVADEDGFRKDVIEATKAMGVTNVRFPGGCYAPFYHFYDGIGPKELRPKKRYKDYNPSHEFGTDEFVKWCRKIDAEPYICVNMGSGTAEEAMQWVEYCNGQPGSYWADKRVEYGNPEPFNVKYWAIGNEIGGDWEYGHCSTPEDYIRQARDYAMLMKAADPSIKLILCGAHFPIDFICDEWNKKVLEELYQYVDYINVHHYIGHDYKDDIRDKWEEMGPVNVHYYLQEYMQLLQDAFSNIKEDIRYINLKKNQFKEIKIALDEYNPWYREDEHSFVPFNHADSMLVGTYFNMFLRNADLVTLCNMAQLVNTIPAMVCKSGTDQFYRQGISYIQEMYTKNKGNTAVDVWCESPTYQGAFYPSVEYLDVSSSVTEDGKKIVLNIVNRNHEEDYDLDITIYEKQIQNVSGAMFYTEDIDATNSFEEPEKLTAVPVEYGMTNVINVKPMSVYVLEIDVL